MNDQCRTCNLRGDMKKCEAVPCLNRDNWYAQEIIKERDALKDRIARIDAERGKDAVMFAVKRDSGAGGECDVDNPNKVPVSPSPTPTIPEGMALVNAKKLNEFRNALETGLAWVVIPEGNCSCHLRPPCNNCIERSSAENDEQEIIGACKQIASILAAAQGERK